VDSVFIGFIIYLVVVLVIGILTMNRNKTQADYLLGGKKLGSVVIAFSERASGESAWLLLGLPGAFLSLKAGLVETWAAVGCLIGIIFSWLFIARKLREESDKYKALTLPEYFASKFDTNSNYIRVIAAIIILYFFTLYVAAQFSGAGKVLNVTFGLRYETGVYIGVLVIVAYTLMGGFFAVAWTDFFQGILMLGTLTVLPIVGLIKLSHISQPLTPINPSNLSWFAGKTGMAAFLVMLSNLSWGLGYTGQPHLVLRYMALKNDKDAKTASIVAILWAIPAFLGAVIIGYVGLKMFGTGHFKDIEKLMPLLAKELLPTWLAGIFISGAIAAMMSTADSQLLVAASAVGEDFYHRVLKKDPGQEKLVLISRVVTFGIGVVALVLALTTKDLIHSLVSYAWGGLGASFGPIILLSLYYKKLNKYGVIAGMTTGFIGTIVWKNIGALQNFVPERLAAYVIAFIVAIVASVVMEEKLDEDLAEK